MNVPRYPVNAPPGYPVWISSEHTTTGYCYREFQASNPGYASQPVEEVYFYPDPNHSGLGASGLAIGIRYNRTDYYGGSRVDTGVNIPPCDEDLFVHDNCPHIPVSITYKAVFQKQGDWISPPPDTYDVFQFDGVGGLRYTNFRYQLTGLASLAPTPCIFDVQVTPAPGIVDFGQVHVANNTFSPAVPRKPFSILLTRKECDDPVRVDGYFENTVNIVQDGLLVPEQDSNFGIGIEDASGNAIPFNQQFVIAQLPASETYHTVQFNAVLKSFGKPKIGPFNGVATIRIFLY